MFNEDIRGLKLPPEMLAPPEASPEQPAEPVPGEIAITEEPFELPFSGRCQPLDVLSRAADQLAALELRATQAEYGLHNLETSSTRQREKTILGIIETLDQFRKVLGSFRVAAATGHQEPAPGGADRPGNTQPITAEGLENLRMMEHVMLELLRGLDVTEIEVRLGKPVDVRQHEVLRTRRRQRQRNGTVVRVVGPGYRTGQRVLRPALVETVQNAPPAGVPARRQRSGTEKIRRK